MPEILKSFPRGCFKGSFLIFILANILSPLAFAGVFRLQSDTYLSQRRGDDLKTETPFFESFSANYLNEKKDGQFDFNFSFYYDFAKQAYDMSLHQLDARIAFAEQRGSVSFGRSFQTYHLIKASTVDSLALDYSFFEGRLKTGVLLGLLRQFEIKDSLLDGRRV